MESMNQCRLKPTGFRRWVCSIRNPASSGLSFSHTFKTEIGKFKFVAADKCLGRRLYNLFDFRVNTPFPLKCRIRWQNERATIEGRMPLFPTAFFVAWLAGWSIFAVVQALRDPVGGLVAFLLGAVFAGGIVAFSIALELRRARALLGEFEARMRQGPLDAL